MLLEHRPEPRRQERDPGQVESGQRLGQCERLEPGRAEHLEWPSGPARFGQVGSLQERHAGIDPRGLDRRDVGGRRDPRQARLRVRGVAPPAAHRRHDEIEIQTALGGEKPRELARSHAMPDRDRVQTHEREECRILRRAFDLSAERVRPVADDEPLPELGACLHREQHRPVVRVVPAADVRDVEHEGVEVGEVAACRRQALPRRAVERDDGKTALAMDRRGHPFHVHGGAVDAMLWSEETSEPGFTKPGERLPRRHPASGDRGVVRDQADPLPRDPRRVGQQRVDSGDGCSCPRGQASLISGSGRGWCTRSPRTRPRACGRSAATA